MKRIYIEQAPAYWASYLMTGDSGDLNYNEIAAALEWLNEVEKETRSTLVNCEADGIGTFNDEQCDLATYTFLGK